MADFYDNVEQIKIESLQLSATLLDLLADGAKVVKKFARSKAEDLREKLNNV